MLGRDSILKSKNYIGTVKFLLIFYNKYMTKIIVTQLFCSKRDY